MGLRAKPQEKGVYRGSPKVAENRGKALLPRAYLLRCFKFNAFQEFEIILTKVY